MKTNQTKPVGASMFRVQGWMLNVVLALVPFSAGSALTAVRYVDVNSTNATPHYSS